MKNEAFQLADFVDEQPWSAATHSTESFVSVNRLNLVDSKGETEELVLSADQRGRIIRRLTSMTRAKYKQPPFYALTETVNQKTDNYHLHYRNTEIIPDSGTRKIKGKDIRNSVRSHYEHQQPIYS